VTATVLGANTVLAGTSLPPWVADTDVLRHTFAVAIALVVASRFRAVVASPAGVALALVSANALAVAAADLALKESGITSVANGDSTLGTLPSLPAPTDTLVTISTIGTVVTAVAGLTVSTRETRMAVTSEGSNAHTPVGAVMRTSWLVTELSLVSGCAV
jgi:hypothetical protein